ncbi:hypothetical protein R6242_16285 [Iodobacter sp. CM08]|uniref:hypothetical protein n=1 Tax=Iodobacter sp. CM08 TaxID=3085902 RepID=UPI002981530C|nr:hypothetical protein [Iodobacter sp. CM08]MDW5418126.1 hypothetical protein [Iodobacter sp. CM08]
MRKRHKHILILLSVVFFSFSQSAFSAKNCVFQRYHLVFAINNSTSIGGIAGYSEATVSSCAVGLTYEEIAGYRKQVASLHRKKNADLKDDQVILLNYQPLENDDNNPISQGELEKLLLL